MAKTNWGLNDVVQPSDLNAIGQEINQLREDVDNIDIPPASLTQAGIVQLSSATNAVDEDKAATPKAVKLAYDAATGAQNTIDTHTNLTTAHGATSAATANRLIVRDSAGRAKIAAPSASDDIARKDTVDNAVGNLSTLLTTAKGNTVAAINELFTSASNGKSQIAAAITGKGVPASGSDTFAVLAAKIGQIITGKRFVVGTANSDQDAHLRVPDFGWRPRFAFAWNPNNENSQVHASLIRPSGSSPLMVMGNATLYDLLDPTNNFYPGYWLFQSNKFTPVGSSWNYIFIEG